MAAAPLAALDLPLKVLIWADDAEVKVSYYAPELPRRPAWPELRAHRQSPGIGPHHRRARRALTGQPT